MTKEEFGLDLFEAVKLQSGIRQAERNRKRYREQGFTHLVKDTEAEIAKRQKQLKLILDKNTITAPDLQRLLAMQ